MRRRFVACAVLLAAVSAVLALTHPAFHALAAIANDTESYLTWHGMRPVLYPAVVTVAAALDPGFRLLGLLQLALFLSAAVALASRVAETSSAPIMSGLLLAGIVLNPQVVSYTFAAIPESLTTTWLMVHVTAVMFFVAGPTRRSALVAGGSTALAILMKPAAVTWLAGLPLLWWALRRDRQSRRSMWVWVGALIVPVALGSAVTLWRFGVFAPQVATGFQTIGLSGPFVDEHTPLEPLRFRTRLMEELRPIRTELESLDSLEWYYFYSAIAYHETLPLAERVIHEVFPETADGSERAYARLNDIAATVTRAALPHAPRAYARHIAAHWYGLWLMPLVRPASERQAFEQQLDQMRTRLPILGANPLMERFVPTPLYWGLRAFLVAAFVGSAAGMVGLLFMRLPPSLVPIAYSGALLQAYFFVTAAAQTGLPRYALAAWPLTMLVVVGWVSWLARAVRVRTASPT